MVVHLEMWGQRQEIPRWEEYLVAAIYWGWGWFRYGVITVLRDTGVRHRYYFYHGYITISDGA